MGYFNHGRMEGFPSQYPGKKSPVTIDILEAGLILAFVIVATAFFIIILGFSLKRSINAFFKVFASLMIGCCLMLGNFGQEWEVGSVATRTPYRAGSPHQINASIGIKLGLRSINITLDGYIDTGSPLENETIHYNERFSWTWDQGRLGFGPYAGLLQRTFREAQRKGLPIPILSIVEYLVVDGEGLRYGRFYRTAGWYTHILMWTAFTTWLLANIFLISVGRYAAYFLLLTGLLQIFACVVWVNVCNPYPLSIPFENGTITPSYGSHFWMALVCGIACVLIAVTIMIMDLRFPDELSSFLGLDPISDYDEYVLKQSQIEVLRRKNGMRSNLMEMLSLGEEADQSWVQSPHKDPTMTVLKRRSSATKAQKALFRLPLPVTPAIDESADDDSPIYENRYIAQPSGSDIMQKSTVSHSREKLCPPLPKKTKNLHHRKN